MQQTITGMVLAGGLARRFDSRDKGLIELNHQPLVVYALDAMKEVADHLVINANRNINDYKQLGYPVISDLDGSFSGPLAGVLSVMQQAQSDYVFSVPCDCPLINASMLQRMVDTLNQHQAECCIPDDGERVHPVFLLLKTELQTSLADYLANGQRKIDRWLEQHQLVKVDCSDQPETFLNVNTPEQLKALEQQMK